MSRRSSFDESNRPSGLPARAPLAPLAPLSSSSRRDLPPLGALRAPAPSLRPLPALTTPNTHTTHTNGTQREESDNTAIHVHRPKPLDIPSADTPIGRPTRLDFSEAGTGAAAPIAGPPRYDSQPAPPTRPPAAGPPRVELGPEPRRQSMGRDRSEFLASPSFDDPPPGVGGEFRRPSEFANEHAGDRQRTHTGVPHGNSTLGRMDSDGLSNRRTDSDGYAGGDPNSLAPPLEPKTPHRSGMPVTPSRAVFSPHAFSGGSKDHAPPATPERRTGSANPPMSTVAELLAPQALQVYLPFFTRLGYTDMSIILSMDDDKLDWMLDNIEAEAESSSGILMKGGHKNHILTRLKQERIKFMTQQAKNKSPIGMTMSERNKQQQQQQQHLNNNGSRLTDAPPPPPPRATSNRIMYDGMKGLVRHWCCCFGLCILLIIISTCFIVLYDEVGRNSDGSSSSGGVNGGDVSASSSGGWKFLYIVSIIGFVAAGIAFLMAGMAWLRNPEHRNCNCRHLLPECGLGFACCRDCCKENCNDFWTWCTCVPCCTSLKECLQTCLNWLREQCFFTTWCPECSCKECCTCFEGCGEGGCCTSIMHECGCEGACSEGGCCNFKECCQDCETPSCDCSCNCCPDCEGDLRSCCGTLYKVCCCQCKIQVS